MAVDPDTISELFEQFDVRLIDLNTIDWVNASAESYDYLQAAADPDRSVAIPPAEDIAKIGRRSQLMPVYLLAQDDEIILTVLPIYGKGMWSEIHAYIALDADLATITDLVIHTHGETPGIGDRIESKQWLQQWRGKQTDIPIIMNGTGSPESTASLSDKNAVDAISGATITTKSLVATVNFWLGDWGYGPLLTKTTRNSD